MTLTLLPVMDSGDTQNQGYVRIHANDLGYVPLLRNETSASTYRFQNC
jgi:hypothetical protein